jgi:hypothetical protein
MRMLMMTTMMERANRMKRTRGRLRIVKSEILLYTI